MKLSLAGAFAVTISFALGQPRTDSSVATIAPEPQHRADTTAEQTISVDVLRQPLSRKARQILEKAQRAAEHGDHLAAIAFLEAAHAKYPESDAWTQSMLGVEYLKTGQFQPAVSVLEQAVLLLPRDAVDHSNLGYALAKAGQYHHAEQELRRALALGHGDPKTRQLLDIVVAAEAAKPPQPSSNVRPAR